MRHARLHRHRLLVWRTRWRRWVETHQPRPFHTRSSQTYVTVSTMRRIFTSLRFHFLPRDLPSVTHRRAAHWDMWSCPPDLFLCHQLKTITVLLAPSPDCWYSVISTLGSCVVGNKHQMRVSFLCDSRRCSKSMNLLRGGKRFRHRNGRCGFDSIYILLSVQ